MSKQIQQNDVAGGDTIDGFKINSTENIFNYWINTFLKLRDSMFDIRCSRF